MTPNDNNKPKKILYIYPPHDIDLLLPDIIENPDNVKVIYIKPKREYVPDINIQIHFLNEDLRNFYVEEQLKKTTWYIGLTDNDTDNTRHYIVCKGFDDSRKLLDELLKRPYMKHSIDECPVGSVVYLRLETVRDITPMRNGKRHGYYETYYKNNGKLWFTGYYRNGKKFGHWVIHYLDGSFDRGVFIDGERERTWYHFDKDTECTVLKYYEKGVVRNVVKMK